VRAETGLRRGTSAELEVLPLRRPGQREGRQEFLSGEVGALQRLRDLLEQRGLDRASRQTSYHEGLNTDLDRQDIDVMTMVPIAHAGLGRCEDEPLLQSEKTAQHLEQTCPLAPAVDNTPAHTSRVWTAG